MTDDPGDLGPEAPGGASDSGGVEHLGSNEASPSNDSGVDDPDRASRSIDISDPLADMARVSRKGFLWAGAALLATGGVYWWLDTRRLEGGKPWPFRRAFEVNERLARALGQGEARGLTEKDVSADPRVNGMDGLAEVDPKDWRLRIEGIGDPRVLTIEQIRALPASELISELNCIEGWTRVMRWRGVKVSDLLRSLGISPKDLPAYVGLETPKRGYYVGLDRESVLHSQSLLAYEIDGQPLSPDHGAPLRHVLPIKYGYKQLKHVGLIRFTADRPDDFWAEQGYDWYGGF